MTEDTTPLSNALLERGGGDFMKHLVDELLAQSMTNDVEG